MTARSIQKRRLTQVDHGGAWTTWVDRSRSGRRASIDTLGRPGLWRAVRRDRSIETSFACPPLAALDAAAMDEGWSQAEQASALEAWALATANDQLSEGWCAPDGEGPVAWSDPQRLTVRAGPHVAKGEFESGGQRLRLVFGELVRLDDALPASRRAWLNELCLDVQSRWQLVRFGVAEERICAEVDLSGVPHALAEPLAVWALEALVFAVGWALPALVLIADPDLKSPWLDRGPWWASRASPAARTRSAVHHDSHHDSTTTI
jgi:hypothetical protein